jgi:hypothetical protein
MDISEADIIRMKESLLGIQDPRRGWGNLRHKLIDMPVIALSTIIIGEHDFEAMEDWGQEREGNLILGQVRTEEKSNGIVAIPCLPDRHPGGCGDDRSIGLKSAGCQRAIAEKIREKQGDYIPAVKENQPLYQDIREYLNEGDMPG